MKVAYANTKIAWESYEEKILQLITNNKYKNILEIGGGANPQLKPEYLKEHGLNYTVLDISSEELDKAPDIFNKVQADICDSDLNIKGEYDLIFSKMLAEHVKDAEVFHSNIHKLLSHNGQALHFFPTLYAFPFVINKLIPEWFAEKILYFLQSGRNKDGNHAKFPAYYDQCKGPVSSQIAFFNKLNYEIEEYQCFFGHSPYYYRIKPILFLHEIITDYLIKNPNPWFTSFACVVLKK